MANELSKSIQRFLIAAEIIHDESFENLSLPT